MTLVMLACVPLLAGIGIAFTVMFTKTQARAETAYAAASGLVQETLSNIRTVFAFSAESRMLARYKQVGEESALALGARELGHRQCGQGKA